MSKGLAPVAIVVIAIASGLMLEGIFLTNFIQRAQTFVRASKAVEIIHAINALEMVKRGMLLIPNYSLSQASYEIAGKGGTTNYKFDGISAWRYYQQTFFPDWEKEVKGRILEISNEYVRDLAKSLPKAARLSEFTNSEMHKIGEDQVYVEVNSTELILEKTDFYKITDKGNFSSTIPSRIYKMFELAKEELLANDIVNEILMETLAEIPTEGSYSKEACSCEEITITCDEVLVNGILEGSSLDSVVKSKLTEKVKELENKLNSKYGNDDFKWAIESEVKTSYKIAEEGEAVCSRKGGTQCCKGSECSATACCVDCKSYTYKVCEEEGTTDPKTGECIEGSPCNTVSTCCKKCVTRTGYTCKEEGKWNDRLTKTCKFSYYASAKVLFHLLDRKYEYLVYNYEKGANSLENLQLKLFLISGNKKLI